MFCVFFCSWVILAQSSTLDEMLKLGLGAHLTAIEETCINAQKEYSLEKALDRTCYSVQTHTYSPMLSVLVTHTP